MQGSFILVPECIFTLPPELLKLWILIRKEENATLNGCTASVAELARLTKISSRQVRTNLSRLKKCGAIRIEERPQTTHRIFCTPENFDLQFLSLPRRHHVMGSN